MSDIHARTSAAFLADAAERCANVGPGNQADCDAAIAAIEAGLDLGAPDPAPAAPLAPVAAPVTVSARYVETRTVDGDLVRRHGPFAPDAPALSHAWLAEMTAAETHNRMRGPSDRGRQRVFKVPA